MKIKFSTLSADERSTTFASMDNDALSAALTEARSEAETLFALTEPTIEQVNEAEVVLASIGLIEAEQTERAEAVRDAAERFAAARAQFSNAPVEGEESEEGAESEEGEEVEEGEESEEGTESAEAEAEGTESAEGEAVTTASARNGQRVPVTAARKVGRKTPRPKVESSQEVVITAAADVQGFATGQRLTGMEQVASAVQARTKGFAPYNQRAAEQVASQSGGEPVLHKFAAASFGVDFDKSLTAAKAGEGYSVTTESIKQHRQRVSAGIEAAKSGGGSGALTAAGWCAPSPVVYNWIADYVIDGLLTLPEVSAPRGGLQTTTGPQLAQTTYANPDDFGFGGTEAVAETGTYVKTCETIECPDFTDHRLDFDGYCWKIPILTEKAFPELVSDALKLSDVLYAHKMNARFIKDVLTGSTAKTASGIGSIVLDTLEALVQIAVKERRWWNIGENAPMEVKLPQVAREIFKFDMARRSGLALNDIATDQKIAAYFANHNLTVEYISDFDDPTPHVTTVNVDWADSLRAIIYPAGTWVKAVEPVINLSAVYDAAALSANEYTGVFLEQGVMTMKMGYRSHVVTVPVCNAGRTGANDLTCAPA